MVRGTKGPGFIHYGELSFPGMNGPGDEWSMDHSVDRSMVYGPFVPENESSTMGTNSLGNEQSRERMFHNSFR